MSLSTHIQFYNPRSGEDINHDLFAFKNKKGEPAAAQLSLIYGRNGSGKSTLAKHLFASLRNGDCRVETLSGEISDALYDDDAIRVEPKLFNADFVSKIGYREEGDTGRLKTIVYFGDQNSNLEEIEELVEKRAAKIEGFRQKTDRIAELGSKKSGEIADRWAEVRRHLKGDGSWSEFRRKVTGTVPKVTDSIVEELTSAADRTRDTPIDQLVGRRKTLLDSILRSESRPQVPAHIQPFHFPWDLTAAELLFLEVPSSHTQSEIESHYLGLLTEVGSAILRKAQNEFGQPDGGQCPMCTQRVEGDLRAELHRALTRVLESQERAGISERIARLEPLKHLEPAMLDARQVEAVEEPTAKLYSQARDKVKKVVEVFNDAAKVKRNSPETKVELPLTELEEAMSELEAVRLRCISEMEKFNEAVRSRERNISEFHKVNIEVAASDADIREALLKLRDANREVKDLHEETERMRQQIDKFDAQLQVLRARELEHEAAMRLMNRFLSVVFGDQSRLYLEPAEQAYRVLSRGYDVPLEELSTGEKNIIALVFYLASIFEESADHTKFAQQRFLIIDDPLSSFDRDNRFGVFLLLRQVIERFTKNPLTQIVVTSHDLGFIQDLSSVVSEVNGVNAVVRTIENHRLTPINLDSYSGYSDLLRKIYNYACAPDPENVNGADVPAGNEMRLVLEAYAQFEVSRGIVDLPTAQIVKSIFSERNMDLAPYFDGRLYKLLLHGESHSADSIRAGQFDLSEVSTREERQEIAQDLIAIISAVSPAHIPAKLGIKVKGTDANDPNHLAGYRGRITRWEQDRERRTLPSIGR